MSDETTNPLHHRYIPPAEIARYQCRRIYIPDSEQYRAAINELLSRLMIREVWEASPFTMSADDAATLAGDMLVKFWRDDCMIGCIIPHARATIPDWALPCNGTEFNRVDYPELYAVIADDFKTGDDTFITPNMDGRFVMGGGDDEYQDFSDGGETEIYLDTSQLAGHSHQILPHAHGTTGYINIPVPAGVDPVFASSMTDIPSTTDLGGTDYTEYTGDGEPINILPPYIVVPYIIIAK